MVKILIADDEPQKIKEVLEILSEFKTLEFIESHSFDSTVDLLLKDSFQLIILDMSLPTFEGKCSESGRMRALGGKDILDIMDYEEINTPVIVFTQFDVFGRNRELITLSDVDKGLRNNYEDIYLGSVMYDSRYSEWKEELLKLLPKGLLSDD